MRRRARHKRGQANLKLASGVAPVYSMLRSGMKVALGTDGSASNNATSMFREMYLFSCLQKEAMKDASAVSAEEALTAATVNGYEALGFRGGVLKTGNFADIILIDLAAPNMRPLSDVKKNLVYSADSSNVLMTGRGRENRIRKRKVRYRGRDFDHLPRSGTPPRQVIQRSGI